jgi:hypothetical protein
MSDSKSDSNIHIHSRSLPFFTRFLETQIQELTEAETQAIQGGAVIATPGDERPPLTLKGGIVSHGDELEKPYPERF